MIKKNKILLGVLTEIAFVSAFVSLIWIINTLVIG